MISMLTEHAVVFSILPISPGPRPDKGGFAGTSFWLRRHTHRGSDRSAERARFCSESELQNRDRKEAASTTGN